MGKIIGFFMGKIMNIISLYIRRISVILNILILQIVSWVICAAAADELVYAERKVTTLKVISQVTAPSLSQIELTWRWTFLNQTQPAEGGWQDLGIETYNLTFGPL